MADDDLNVKLAAAAEKLVGTKAVMKTGYGKDCFVLVDMLLRQIGAATASDGEVAVTPTADYDWGDGIMLDHIQPGDVLQFSKHLIHIETSTFDDYDKLIKTEERWLTRPHHTAIVIEVHKDNSVTVIEQNVHPSPNTVNRNLIPALEGTSTKEVKLAKGRQKIKMTVTGSVSAYRPTTKPTSSSLQPRHSPGAAWRAMASIIPSQGGGKRLPGPFGTSTA